MKNLNPDPLGTPIYLYEKNAPWPSQKFFYLLTGDGLMICRHHPWFQSCARAQSGPKDLPSIKPFVKPIFPLIPQKLMERAVGFCWAIHDKDHWESAVIFVWNRLTHQVELLIPDQQANACDVRYEVPNLPDHLTYLGDLHSHGYCSPHPSLTDEEDEKHRTGVHLIVGDIAHEPPDFGCVIVADGNRYEVEPKAVIEGYQERSSEVPSEWLDKVKYKSYATGNYYGSSNWQKESDERLAQIRDKDRKLAKKTLDRFRKQAGLPLYAAVRERLFSATRALTYVECEKMAQEFIDELSQDPKRIAYEQARTQASSGVLS